MAPLMAGVFARRGVDAWVFRGDDGLDELTTTTTSQVWAVDGGEVREFTVDPARFGLGGGTAEGLRGRDAAYNADVVRRLVAGEPGQVRDAVVLNAGAALAVHAAEDGATGGASRRRRRPGGRVAGLRAVRRPPSTDGSRSARRSDLDRTGAPSRHAPVNMTGLRELQAPPKQRYQGEPEVARHSMGAAGDLADFADPGFMDRRSRAGRDRAGLNRATSRDRLGD